MRKRRTGNDYIYSVEHMERFPEQYRRIEHRFKLADIDWAEFCGFCHWPVMLVEMYRDTPRGQDLSDKGVTVTRRLARGVMAQPYVMAYLTERPREVQREIDQLNARILELTRAWPMTRIRAQLLEPYRGPVQTLTVPQWWELVALRHSEHNHRCGEALRSREVLANSAWISAAQARARRVGLWTPEQPALDGLEAS